VDGPGAVRTPGLHDALRRARDAESRGRDPEPDRRRPLDPERRHGRPARRDARPGATRHRARGPAERAGDGVRRVPGSLDAERRRRRPLLRHRTEPERREEPDDAAPPDRRRVGVRLMPFTRPTLPDLRDRIRPDFAARLPGAAALLRQSNLRVIADVLAELSNAQFDYESWLSLQLFPDTCETVFLDRWASIWGVEREDATAAGGTITATGTAGAV